MAQQILDKLPPGDQPKFEPLDEILLQNLGDYKELLGSDYFKQYESSELVFSQFNMSMVHMAFFEGVIMYPQQVY